jgi:hypothetical protein
MVLTMDWSSWKEGARLVRVEVASGGRRARTDSMKGGREEGSAMLQVTQEEARVDRMTFWV